MSSRVTVIIKSALAGVVQWTEFLPANQRVAGLIPSLSTCLGCSPGPWLGGAREVTLAREDSPGEVVAVEDSSELGD